MHSAHRWKGFHRWLAAGLIPAAAAVFLIFSGIPVRAASKQDMQSVNIIYDFGDGEYYAVNGIIAQSLLAVNPDGSLYVDKKTKEYVPDEQKIRIFVEALDNLYPENANAADFIATDGRVVSVQGGDNSRRYMNYEYEKNYLFAALEQGLQQIHAPVYGLGQTYVEIDLTGQVLYYYENGIQKFTTPVVTGNLRAGNGTPTGIFRVNSKARNQYLVGGSEKNGTAYRSFVNYWVNIYRNAIGIHDATWRSRFGGEIYRTAGSHGCINVPLSNMEQLYPMLQTGTPVVVFY